MMCPIYFVSTAVKYIGICARLRYEQNESIKVYQGFEITKSEPQILRLAFLKLNLNNVKIRSMR